MGIYKSYLNSAVSILKSYRGQVPFHLYLKNFFSSDKKYGSRDRKSIASLCFYYFRLGHASMDISIEERIMLGTFLCENKSSDFLKEIKPEWKTLMESTFKEKFSVLRSSFSCNNIFPYQDELSKGIDFEKFCLSFLIQPDLFLRIRPGNKKRVTGKLAGAGIPYKVIQEDCIALSNSSKVDTVIELDKEAVVQDFNSQRIGEMLKLATSNQQPATMRIWDCCAASGGKSIMAYDINPQIDLTVSDKRSSILQNLDKRFLKAGIKNYHSFVTDLSVGVQTASGVQTGSEGFDVIIADVPCTGSGTWARTPEQLYFFKKEKINEYATLQKQILNNVIPHLKKNGYLLYITCSVFKKENEEVVNFIEKNSKLRLKKLELFKGYEKKADTMFAALFKHHL